MWGEEGDFPAGQRRMRQQLYIGQGLVDAPAECANHQHRRLIFCGGMQKGQFQVRLILGAGVAVEGHTRCF